MTNPSAPTESLPFSNLSTLTEGVLNEKFKANKKFNNTSNILKGIETSFLFTPV